MRKKQSAGLGSSFIVYDTSPLLQEIFSIFGARKPPNTEEIDKTRWVDSFFLFYVTSLDFFFLFFNICM